MTIDEIRELPENYQHQTLGVCHESLLKSYQVLLKVYEMLYRQDSRETITEVIDSCYRRNGKSSFPKFSINHDAFSS